MIRTFCDRCGDELTLEKRTAISMLQLGRLSLRFRPNVHRDVQCGDDRATVCAPCWLLTLNEFVAALNEKVERERAALDTKETPAP